MFATKIGFEGALPTTERDEMVRESSSKMLLLVSDVTTTFNGFGGPDEDPITRRGKETNHQNDEDEDEDAFDEDEAREKVRAAVNLCESSARMKTMLVARSNKGRQIFEAKDDVVEPREGKTTRRNHRLLKASVSSGGVKTTSSSREKSFFVVDDDVNDVDDECREEMEIAAVSWFPPATTTQKDDGKDAGEDDGGVCCVPWTKASSSESKRSVGERLRVTQCERSMRAKKTAEDLFMEEIQTPTKKVKKNTGKRDATTARTENGLLHKRAAREAMKLIDDVKRNELSAMDIVCLIPILVDDDAKNTTPFDANDPMKWPKNLVLAHGVVKRAKERFGGEKVRVKIVPIFVAATPEENETTSDAKATETRSAREALINARLEQVSNVWGFTNTVVGSTSSTVVSDASVMWRGKILIGGGLKTKLSSKMKNKSNDKGKNNSGRSRSSTYRTYDRCIAAVEVSRECSQCVMPFLPAEPSSDNLDDVEGLEEERDGETKAIQTATAKKSSSSSTTTKSWKKASNRKIEEDEGEDETVLKIYDIVLMSAIDAIDIDASQAPRHVSFSPINTSNWMTAYASFCAKKYDEGIPGECPVLLCSIATATPMVVACDKKGAFDDKEEEDDDNDVRSKNYGRALVVKDTNKFFPAQSRDERVFVLAPFFSTMNTKKGTSRTSVAFRLVKLVDARSALERRVLFPRTSNQNQNEDVDFYSSQPPLLALPGSDTRRLSVEEERLDEALKTVAKMVVSRGGSSTSSKEGDGESNEEEKFERISGVIDAYFAKRKKRRGGKASAKDDSMREYCIAWMKFLYFTKKDASTIAATSSTTLHHHHNSNNNNNYNYNNNNGNNCSAEKRNDEEGEEHNELKRFYDALENASKETADDIRHDVSLASVLRSAAVDCEKKLEKSETVARLLRSRMPSRNVVLKRKAGGKDGDGFKKRQKAKKGVTAKKRAKNANVTAAAAATTTPNDVTDKLAKFRQGGGGVAGELKKRHAHANNPTMTTTNTTNSSAEEIRKRKLNAAASTLRYNNRNNAPSNGSALVAMATNNTNTTNNNTTTASLSQQRPSESGAGSGAFGGRGRGTTSCQKCNRDLEVKSGMNYCPYCGGPLHR